MIFLKALLIFLLNFLLVYPFAYIIRAFFFHPHEKKYLFKRHVPFTPALLYRWKNWIFDKIRGYLNEFFRECEDSDYKGRIREFEEKVYNATWEKIEVVHKLRYVPGFIKRQIQIIVSQIAYQFVSYFIRTFIPYLIEEYGLESYVDILEIKLDIKVLEGYYNRYFNKLIFYASLPLFFLLGIYNMLIYLIIR